MRPYYQNDSITLYHGDSREILPELSFDIIVTDPPYGIALNTDFGTRGQSNAAQCRDYKPIVGDGGLFDPTWLQAFGKPTLLWGGNYFADKLPATAGWLVWDKVRPLTADQAQCELAWTNFVKGVRIFSHNWNGFTRAGEERGVRHHPAQKPVALLSWVIGLPWFPKEGVIADPYMGTGSTLVAAARAGRRAIGIEVEESYCEIAVKRLDPRLWMEPIDNKKKQPARLDFGLHKKEE